MQLYKVNISQRTCGLIRERRQTHGGNGNEKRAEQKA